MKLCPQIVQRVRSLGILTRRARFELEDCRTSADFVDLPEPSELFDPFDCEPEPFDSSEPLFDDFDPSSRVLTAGVVVHLDPVDGAVNWGLGAKRGGSAELERGILEREEEDGGSLRRKLTSSFSFLRCFGGILGSQKCRRFCGFRICVADLGQAECLLYHSRPCVTATGLNVEDGSVR